MAAMADAETPGAGVDFGDFVAAVIVAVGVVDGVHIALLQQLQYRLSAHAGVEHAARKPVQRPMLVLSQQLAQVQRLYALDLFACVAEILHLLGKRFPLRSKVFVAEMLFGGIVFAQFVQDGNHFLQPVGEPALDSVIPTPHFLPVFEAVRYPLIERKRTRVAGVIVERFAQRKYLFVVARDEPLEVRQFAQHAAVDRLEISAVYRFQRIRIRVFVKRQRHAEIFGLGVFGGQRPGALLQPVGYRLVVPFQFADVAQRVHQASAGGVHSVAARQRLRGAVQIPFERQRLVRKIVQRLGCVPQRLNAVLQFARRVLPPLEPAKQRPNLLEVRLERLDLGQPARRLAVLRRQPGVQQLGRAWPRRSQEPAQPVQDRLQRIRLFLRQRVGCVNIGGEIIQVGRAPLHIGGEFAQRLFEVPLRHLDN